MLQYLIILLDDISTSYCHFDKKNQTKQLISLENLKAAIFYGMKENLMIQFVYPDYELPKEYKDVIDSIDHNDIVSSLCEDKNLVENADIIIVHDWTGIIYSKFNKDKIYTLRTSKDDLFDRYKSLSSIIKSSRRLNIVITDVENFTESDFLKYKEVLNYLNSILLECFVDGRSPQLNLLTDRMELEKMNNCNAGYESITIAPDGNFYICPAFYYAGACDGNEKSLSEICEKGYPVGTIKDGLEIKNAHLYQLEYAPLCRKCDAYQCRRCIWLNRKTTLEVNTPSHEQCVIAHLERNASRQLLTDIRKTGVFLPGREIKEINYLDPFDKLK